MPTPPSERALRIARNESRFREINHRLAADLRPLVSPDEPLGFVCECGHPECSATLEITMGEYEAVRADPMHFAVLPDHQIEDVEDVVQRGAGLVVVRKHEPVRPLAEESDPS